MGFLCLGINHRTCPLAVRERLSFSKREMPEAILGLKALPGVEEAVLVSTCNRVELYAVTGDIRRLRRRLEVFLQRSRKVRRSAFARSIYSHEDLNAVRHLMFVAAGLDSQVVGEPQILSQVREAYMEALRAGATSAILNGVFNRALAAAKRVRHETEIGRLPASVSSVAVELAERVFGDFNGRTVLLLGTGETSTMVAEHLLGKGAPKLLVAAEKHHDRARELAARYSGEAVPLARARSRLTEVDIVIVATASPNYVLSAGDVSAALASRRSGAMFLIDLSVPRNIDPAAGTLENAFLYNLDDLKSAASENLKRREQWIGPAGEIVDEGVRETEAWLESLKLIPTIVALQGFGERCRQEVWARAGRTIRDLPEGARRQVDYLTRALVAKILHNPISQLKQHRSRPILTEALRRLFKLDG